MPNPFTRAWSYLSSPHPAVQRATRPSIEQKFAPSSAEVPWERIQSLIYTAGSSDPTTKGDGNSAVFACLMALSIASIEAPLRVFQKDASDSGGEFEPAEDHPLQAFLDEPNPWLDMLELRFWTTWAKHLDGNAYLLKVRSGNAITGNTIELWPISPLLMTPWKDKGSGSFIDSYRYETKPGKYEYVPPENVIHFRLGIDDRDTRKGLSPLKRLIREIASDSEATRFADALLRNFGIPGLVVVPPKEADLSPDQAQDLKQRIIENFGSDNRGNVTVLTGGADMKQFGFSPDQLNLEALHNVPETRICAVMGVPPAVANVNVGLAQTSNYASLRAVYEAFTERKLVPLWKMDEAKWNRQLKPDFTSDRNVAIRHDLSDVRALQEDEQALHERTREDFRAGLITREMGLRQLGYDADLAPDEILSIPPNATFVRVADSVEDPNAAPQMPPQLLPVDQPPGQNPPALPPGKGLEIKAGDLDRWPELMQGLIELAVPAFADDLNKHWDSQRRRVKRRLLETG